MSRLLQGLQITASNFADRTALTGAQESLSYGELNACLRVAAKELQAQNIRVLGLLADNGLPWVLADLTALVANVPIVPLPSFFSPAQMLHVMQDTGMDGLLTDQLPLVESLLHSTGMHFTVSDQLCGLQLIRLHGTELKLPPQGTVKISYTSGTTGEPKGVCLSLAQLEAVAISLVEASAAVATDRHLCLTPLSTLLENIGGIYTPLLVGASACVLPLAQVGLSGASALDVGLMQQALTGKQASTAILAPQMLQALVVAGERSMPMPPTLRFLAVGGAPVSPHLLQRAHELGLPVFEGYGLSECASVVTLNRPGDNRPGSVGRPLPHVRLSFADDGEILVHGPTFPGYLGQGPAPDPWPTGDLGHLDSDGYLTLSGRKKSIYITSFGRNVAPEWVEQELNLQPAIAQAAVFGEARPFNVAIIWPRAGYTNADVDLAVGLANQSLPDYARIATTLAADKPFSPDNGQMTANGRIKRDAILARYGAHLEMLYREEKYDVL